VFLGPVGDFVRQDTKILTPRRCESVLVPLLLEVVLGGAHVLVKIPFIRFQLPERSFHLQGLMNSAAGGFNPPLGNNYKVPLRVTATISRPCLKKLKETYLVAKGSAADSNLRQG
jgi:hypothetical protein